MYKPPENTNRVKAMKSKFENNDKTVIVPVKTLTKVPILLERQLSDPVKVSIKRSPAFRNDKVLQRNSMQVSGRSKSSENKSLTSKICDNKITPKPTPPVLKSPDVPLISATNFNVLRKRFDSQENLTRLSPELGFKERSNTSAEIILNRERIQKTINKVKDKPNIKNEVEYENITALYTEPIPKLLRPKPGNLKTIHNSSTLKLGEKINSPKLVSETINKSISTNSGHKKCHDDINQKLNALTDTLKIALKKPLPAGPAPKKPPRTFQHFQQSQVKVAPKFENELNKSLQKNINMHTKPPRNDPKYMLDKLEYALKNNRIRLKRHVKADYTSEEDNCDNDNGNESKCNLNCLQSLSCSNATYDSVNNMKPTFFVNNSNAKKEEPVYAEPFVFPKTDCPDNKKNNRNSLYYMSTPVTSNMDNSLEISNNDEQTFPVEPGDTSSISTPTTSDMDSLTSTPSEENKTFPTPKIRDLIKSFEPKMVNTIETRVDQLGKHLRRTINTSFIADETLNDSSSDKGSNDGESTEKRVEEYGTYLRTIRTKLSSKSGIKQDASHLFHCCLLVGLDGKVPYVKFHFPKNVDLPLKVEELCFPDAVDSKIDVSPKAQNYTIVVTNVNGKRMYGYCRRVLPENSNTCLPLAYCILSKQRAPRFYKMILKEIESRHGLPDKMREVLLNEFYYQRFPSPGESIRINLVEINKYTSDLVLSDDNQIVDNSRKLDLSSFTYVNHDGGYGTLNRKSSLNSSNKRNGVLFHNGIIPKDLIDNYNNDNLTSLSTPNDIIITLHKDSRYKETDIQELCDTLDQDILLQVFASILLERKVIFISCRLGKLSTCIEAIESMIHPFSWQHTLIAVVPKCLWEIVEAPTPLICGVLSLSVVNLFSITDGIVIDLDEGAILKSVQDEKTILPKVLRNEFKSAIALAYDTKPKSTASNVLLSDAFLRIFIRSCGHYKAFIKNGLFQKEEFIQYSKCKSIKAFLKWFTETSMFYDFIENAFKDVNSFNNFDKRIEIYSSQEATSILEKMKDWKRDKNSPLFF